MNTLRAAVVSLGLVLGSLPFSCSAFEQTTGDLLSQCEDISEKSEFLQGWCHAYVFGISQGIYDGMYLSLGEDDAVISGWAECISGKSAEQSLAVFIKWAKDNPELWDLPANDGVFLSFHQSFCPSLEFPFGGE